MEKVVATGYLRNVEDATDLDQYGIARRYEVLFDLMTMVSTSLLGLTFECARCHDHKYDPIPQRDYFRLLAYFESSYNVHNWLKPQERWIPDVGPARRQEIDAHNGEVAKKVDDLQNKIKELEKAGEKAAQQQIDSLQQQIADLNATRQSYGKIKALFDVNDPPTSRVLRRGDCFKPGILVSVGTPEVLTSLNRVERIPQPPETQPLPLPQGTAGRRLALAGWITSPENPITARVVMNRLWLHHFGKAIVATPGNFGRSGSPPTHPEILDWLAVEFQQSGWGLKHMHRIVLLSRAYRQTSNRPDDVSGGEQVDPDNKLLWRMNLQRIESELIRDAVLATSNRLNLHAFGPSVPITTPVSGLSTVQPSSKPNAPERRSVYLFARRVYPLRFMELFDAPIMPVNCTRRINSTTVLQSFALLNSDFMIISANEAARNILQTTGDDRDQLIVASYRKILSRNPAPDEMKACQSFLDDQSEIYQDEGEGDTAFTHTLSDLCHMLMCSNEFLYVD